MDARIHAPQPTLENRPPAPGAAAAGRNQGIDLLKLAAIFAVVCIHVPRSGGLWQVVDTLSRFAVPAFFMISGYFFTRSHLKGKPLGALFVSYAWRLSIVFLAWTLFYLVVPPYVNTTVGLTTADRLFGALRKPHYTLLFGHVVHLWFLSSLIQGLLIYSLCLKWRKPKLALAIGAALYVLTLLMGGYRFTAIGLAPPTRIMKVLEMGPMVSTLLVAMGGVLAYRARPVRMTTALLLAVGGLALHMNEWLFLRSLPGSASHPPISFLFGTPVWALGLVMMAIASPNLGMKTLPRLGAYTLGVYVFHLYVLKSLITIPQLHPLTSNPPVTAVLTFAISLLVVIGASRVRWLAPLFR